MASQDEYTLECFMKHGRKSCPSTFKIITDTDHYKFDPKTYVDEDNIPHRVDVLRVGSYHRRAGGPQVWALATTHSVFYFWGHHGAEVLTFIPDKNRSRIYYNGLFRMIAGGQVTRSTTPTGRLGQKIVETMVSFVFLLTDRLERVVQNEDTNMLGNLEYACRTYLQGFDSGNEAMKSETQGSDQTQRERNKATAQGPRLKLEDTTDQESLFLRSSIGGSSFQLLESVSPTRPSLIAQAWDEYDLAAISQATNAAHQHELEAHQARLTAQEAKTHAALDKLAKKRRMIQTAEKQADDWKRKFIVQEQEASESKAGYETLADKYTTLKERYTRTRERVKAIMEELVE